MNNKLNLKIDKILWTWWLGKDDDQQEAFEDLFDTIVLNREDLDIKPWSSSTMLEITINVTTDQSETLKELADDSTLDEYINGCLTYLRQAEEKMKSIFKVTK